MKFIFPQNYNFNSKLFGVIEYSTALFDIIWSTLVGTIINILFLNISLKIFLFIILVFPIIIFSIVGVNGENIVYFIFYIIKYILKPKILFYEK